MSNTDPALAMVPEPPASSRSGTATQTPGGVQAEFNAIMPRPVEADRPKGPTETASKREWVAWRPTIVYVSAISADSEIGILGPPFAGTVVTRVRMVTRTTWTMSGTDYWSITIQWRDSDGNEFPLVTLDLDTRSITANKMFTLWSQEPGIRLEAFNELTMKVSGTGSPVSLEDVTIYCDSFVGI